MSISSFHSTLHRAPHRHHRLLALVVLLVLVLLALPLLGQHSHRQQSDPHAAGMLGSAGDHCAHHGDQATPDDNCHCLHGGGALTLLTAAPYTGTAPLAATPDFATIPAFAPAAPRAPPYRPPIGSAALA